MLLLPRRAWIYRSFSPAWISMLPFRRSDSVAAPLVGPTPHQVRPAFPATHRIQARGTCALARESPWRPCACPASVYPAQPPVRIARTAAVRYDVAGPLGPHSAEGDSAWGWGAGATIPPRPGDRSATVRRQFPAQLGPRAAPV